MQHDPNRKNINHRGGDDPLGAFLAAFPAEYYQVMAIHAKEKNRVAVNDRHLPAWEVPRLAEENTTYQRHYWAIPKDREPIVCSETRKGKRFLFAKNWKSAKK